jgi:hypothetical protein
LGHGEELAESGGSVVGWIIRPDRIRAEITVG